MEADWEVELGGDAPIIDAFWPGFIDLQKLPNRVSEIAEIRQLPALGKLLLRLNDAQTSPVWTAKCDVWIVEAFDPDELDAPTGSAEHALACYIDLLPRSDQKWNSLESAVADCKARCARLRSVALHCCRADLIVRRALLAPDTNTPDANNLGITVYLTGCGDTPEIAVSSLSAAVCALADALAPSREFAEHNS
jgi:hypothetical protein